MTDCLIIGHNDGSFEDHVSLVKSMGTDSGAWRDLDLAFVEMDGRPYRSMDIVNLANERGGPRSPAFSNLDFFWPALPYLATYLTRRGFTADCINLFQDEKERLRRCLLRGDVLTVAVTTTLYVAPWAIEEVVRFVRDCHPSVTIVLGGPFVHNQSRLLSDAQFLDLLVQLDADIFVISSEGESALAQVLGAIKAGREPSEVPNIAYRRPGGYVRTPPAPEANRLADNMVDYGLFPPERFGQFVSVRTSKSCPFACAFCGFPQRAGAYAYEGLEMVEQELDAIHRLGTVTTLTFLDDTFNVPKPRFKEIMRLMIRKGYGFRWNSFLRADHVDEECIALMRDSGCEGVFLGVESGSDRMLALMNKTSRSAHYRRVIPWLRQAGIVTYCSLIVGFPGENAESLRETFALIDEAQPDFYRAQLWYCDPATPIWAKRDALGVSGSAFSWRHPTMDAAAASQAIDEAFLTPRSSLWLPQHGFELWSVFYLQRQGMSLAQVKQFVHEFDEAVRGKLRRPAARDVDPVATQRLLASARIAARAHRADARA